MSGQTAASLPIAGRLPSVTDVIDVQRNRARPHRRVLPGFGLGLGYTLLYLGLIVLIPLSAAFIKTAQLTWPAFVDIVTAPRVVASHRLTFGAALGAAAINMVFGMIVAWVHVRYRFPGQRLVDALVDLPFALPTAGAADRICPRVRARYRRIRLGDLIAGNMPMVSEITPLLIITKLEQYDYTGATAIAVVMLVVSFALLLTINGLQLWTRKRQGALT